MTDTQQKHAGRAPQQAQQQITQDDLFHIIGQKEVQAYALQRQLQESQNKIQELTDENARLKTEHGANE